MKKLLLSIIFLFSTGSASLRGEIYSVGLDKSLYTSDFMLGKVVVSVVFTESDGSLDPNIENWSDDRKAKVLEEILTGLNWWKDQNPTANLSFTVVSETLNTQYEPILRPYYDEALWIPDVLGKLGYTGSRFQATQSYVNDLRNQYDADWGYVIYVVDSLADPNGKFVGGFFAYAYLGGPFMVMTYDNNGYGIQNMDVVTAHETGHIFHALDEYAGASSPSNYSSGYFLTINGNHAFSNRADKPDSIMRGGIRWGLSRWTKEMVGWRDRDNNNLSDIIDPPANSTISSNISNSNQSGFEGLSRVNVLPRQANAQGFGFTVDTIAAVEYRVSGGEWVTAIPVDGKFDSAEETFRVVIDVSALTGIKSVQANQVEIRTSTAYQMLAPGGDGSSPSATSTSLSNVHPFPNPFKPNSSLGHVNVTFTGLTAGAKVQVFTVSGETVFEKSIDSAASTLQWNAVNDDGSNLSSGVYFYLVSDPSGNTKKGKIAIIR